MAGEFGDSQLVKMLDQRQEARLVGWHVGVGRANQEGLIAFVAATFDQVGGFGVGAGDDEAGNAHDVELEAGRVQSLVLLVLRHKHFAALMAALLGARTLVLDVVARNAGFHETAENPERSSRRAAPQSSANADTAGCDPPRAGRARASLLRQALG